MTPRCTPLLMIHEPRKPHSHAGYGQQHGVRQAESLGERHQHAHDDQDHRNRQQGVESICHLT
jgi:hypothetical protein